MSEDKLQDILEGIGWTLFFLTLIFALNACGVCRNCKYQTTDRDSIYVERVDSIFFRDTIVQVQMRDSIVEAVTDSHSLSHLETDIAISDAWVEGDSLYHTLENKRELVPIQVQMPNAITKETKNHFHIVTKMVEREFKWWEEALMYLGKIMLFITVCFIILKLIEGKLKK